MLRVRTPYSFIAGSTPTSGLQGLTFLFGGLLGGAAPPVTGTQAWINVAGTWRQATVYINVGGVWKVATPYVKVGTWR
jgi:hypothetical protein